LQSVLPSTTDCLHSTATSGSTFLAAPDNKKRHKLAAHGKATVSDITGTQRWLNPGSQLHQSLV